MARVKITNSHGLTASALRTYEKQERKANLRTQIMVVRVIMEGKLGKEAADICNVHRQTVSEYVRRFHEGGLDVLLERKAALGRQCFLQDDQQKALQDTILTSSPAVMGWERLHPGQRPLCKRISAVRIRLT